MGSFKGNKRELLLQIVKFTAVGIVNTAITLALIRLLNWLLGSGDFWAQVAYAIGYVVGVVFSYFINRRWTFQSNTKKPLREFLLFAFVNAISWGLSQLTLYLLLTYAGITDAWIAGWCPAFLLGLLSREFLCEILAMPSAFVVNFVGSRLLVFRKAKGEGS